jgi:GTP-binding protein Era
MAAEIIREKLLRTLDEEIPHGTAVVIEEWKEKRDLVSIRAEIYCEKDTHKGIIIGKGGAAIKTVGSYARQDIENMLGVKVFLDLYVRVKKNWRDNEFNLQNFGFADEE